MRRFMLDETVSSFIKLGALLFIVGCSDDAVSNLVEDPQLNGRYMASDCESIGIGEAGISKKESLVFEINGGFQKIEDYYTNADCSGEPAGTARLEGRYQVDGEGDSVTQGSHLGIELTNAYMVSRSANLSSIFTLSGYCGVNEFVTDEEIEITTNAGEGLCIVRESLPETLYGVYQEKDGVLFLNKGGLSEMGQSQQDRPNQLDQEKIYVKQ